MVLLMMFAISEGAGHGGMTMAAQEVEGLTGMKGKGMKNGVRKERRESLQRRSHEVNWFG
jgi:hypothetical protein